MSLCRDPRRQAAEQAARLTAGANDDHLRIGSVVGAPPRWASAVEGVRLLASCEAPALIAWSREDRYLPPLIAETLAEFIPFARLKWVEDSYTFSPEDQPGRAATLIADVERVGVLSPSR